jgi:hypothetical protein
METQTMKCLKCGNDGKRWGSIIGKEVYYDGPYWCNTCDESFCDSCGSHNLKYYDDGEGYPPNILCKDCKHWPQ